MKTWHRLQTWLALALVAGTLAACSTPAVSGDQSSETATPPAVTTNVGGDQIDETAIQPALATDVGDQDGEQEVARPAGWNDATHAKTVEPDYEQVFAQDQVNRIDITISPENWQAMLDDMSASFGEFGSGSGRPGNGADGGMPAGRQANGGQGVLPQRPADADGNLIEPPTDADGNPIEPPAGRPANGGEGVLPQRPADADGNPIEPPTDADGNPIESPTDADGNPIEPPAGIDPGQRPQRGGDMARNLDMGADPIWVPSTVTFEDDVWTQVGIRFKGNSTLRDSWSSGSYKISFKLDFDQFEDQYPETDDQRFYGFKQLSLAGNAKDDSLLREKVTADIFSAAGLVAPRTAFYELYLDYGQGPVYFGLYTMVEVVEDTVVETQFEDGSGNVYKPEGAGATFAAGAFDERSFAKQSNEDAQDWSDIEALFAALHAETRTSDPAAWRQGLESVLDVDSFLNWLAVNTLVQNWDTYGVMSHNFYLYADPTSGLLTWIPWDNNMALSDSVGMGKVLELDMSNVDERWPLIDYLLADEVYYQRYTGNLAAAIEEPFEPAAMSATYQQLHDLIAPYVAAESEDYTHLASLGDFEESLDELIAHVNARYVAAQEFLANVQ